MGLPSSLLTRRRFLAGSTVAIIHSPRRSLAADSRTAHPNLFLDRDEIKKVRERVASFDWARALYRQLRVRNTVTLGEREAPPAPDPLHSGSVSGDLWSAGKRLRDVAIAYAIDDDAKCAAHVRETLLDLSTEFAETPDGEKCDANGFGSRFSIFPGGIGGILLCWAYDLIHQTLSDEDRASIENFLLAWARESQAHADGHAWGLNNCTFWGVAFCGVAGYTLGDRNLIRFAVESPLGLKNSLETMVHDRALWAEAPAYDMYYLSSAMSALAEAAWHYDRTDLYRYQSPSGNSMRNVYDACLALTFPVDLRVANWGDYSSQSPFVAANRINTGHHAGDTFLINDRDGRDWNKYELAWLRYGDPAYAWVLAQNPLRDHWDDALWGALALTHGAALPDNPQPPEARSSILPATGTAMLRAHEGCDYWTTPAPATCIRFGPWVNHGHPDAFHFTLHGQGALLYPDWFVQWDYSRTPRNPTPWSKSTAAHNTVMVDRKRQPRLKCSLDVAIQDWNPAVKILRITGEVYPGVEQSRTFALTSEYLLDVFACVSSATHTYDWIVHGLGKLTFPGQDMVPYDLGADWGFGIIDTSFANVPENRWIVDGHTAATSSSWSSRWRHESGKGVVLTMLGEPDTVLFRGETPDYVGHYGFSARSADGIRRTIPMAVARRQTAATAFVAMHVPFADDAAPELTLKNLSQADGVEILEVKGDDWVDYLLQADDLASSRQIQSPVGTVAFAGGWAYLRICRDALSACGNLLSISLNASAPPASGSWTVNGARVHHKAVDKSRVWRLP